MSELQPLLDLLSGKFGWLATVVTWVGAIRLAVKPFNSRVQAKLTAAMAEAAASPDVEDDRMFEGLLGARWYRLLHFGLDLGTSIKLPTLTEFLRLKNQQTSRDQRTQMTQA